jgi:putative transposase
VSIQTEREVLEPVHISNSLVGVDVGVKQLATLSDGVVFESVNSFAFHQKGLAKLQRQASKKVKYSQNWKKSMTKVRLLHRKISQVRNDYLHKTTSTISKNHAIVFIEDLQIKNMSKSASGNKAIPGKNVKAKSSLNRAILDQGWFEFRRQIEYKQNWQGGMVIAVPPKNTSRTCPSCNFISANNRKTQAEFMCIACGYKNHADIVGAINVLRAGHARLACGEMVQLGHSMKQEPTEVIQEIVA